MTIKCFKCGREFDRKRSNAHYCHPCRTEVNRNATRARMTARRMELRDVAGRIDRGNPYDVAVTIEQIVGEEEERGKLARNEMPPGARTAYGPEEGRSTFSQALREELDILSVKASVHPWWQENPHWNIGL